MPLTRPYYYVSKLFLKLLHNDEIDFFKWKYSEFMTRSYIQATNKKILDLKSP